ncbi:hypothetical protein PMAYCL1PPCAC_18305 [Pristionchus mayeri]|uniref:Tetraspanin n=1 Tax=Pristionchus mayeri TaxID=1317129 RepID=A0AAN5CPA9_9BILA|nr:hypothetical protein PMAYCL1PPCAC_18305 [Pristionchus mayeri]
MARSEDDDDSSEVNCCTKYAIFIFNVIFFFIGFLMVALGTFCQIDNGGMYKKMQNTGQMAMDPTLLLILIGIVIFIIGFCGCLGSLRENTILLTIYTYALIAILLIELAIGIFLYFYKDKFMEMMENMLAGMIPAYNSNEDLQEIIDQLQISMKCCGMKGPDDWDGNPYFMKDDSPNATPDSNGVPYSCCINHMTVRDGKSDINPVCGRQKRLNGGLSHDIFQVGCVHAIDMFIKKNGLGLMIGLVVVLIVQGVAIVMAQNMKADVQAQKAKWVE